MTVSVPLGSWSTLTNVERAVLAEVCCEANCLECPDRTPVRGQDPLDFAKEVPDVFADVQQRFPDFFGKEKLLELTIEVRTLHLSLGDPGLGRAERPADAPEIDWA